MPASLERVRGYSLLATLLLLPLLVTVVTLGAASDGRQPWEGLYMTVGGLLLVASMTFTVAAIGLAVRRTRRVARPRSASPITVFGLLALVVNITVIALTGRVNALNVVLPLLVGGLLLLLREHVRREAVRARGR